MTTAFSKSSQTLHNDHGNGARIGLLLASLLLIAWMVWLFTARITIYETGAPVAIDENGVISATFPVELADRLVPGQMALLQPSGRLAQEIAPFSAMLMSVQATAQPAQLNVELTPQIDSETFYLILEHGLSGQIQVEIEQLSPVRLLARLSGKWMGMTDL